MRRSAAAVTAFLLLAGVFACWILWRDEKHEHVRYESGETEIIVSHLASSTLVLFKSGRTMSDAIGIASMNLKSIWLMPGNYFLRSAESNRTAFYPITLTGYRSGPDEDGSFVVTIRSIPREAPPRLLRDLPEFIHVPSGFFLMGDRQNPREPHYVWLTGFFIAPFEVTNAEFRLFLDAADGYGNDANWTDQGKLWKAASRSGASALLHRTDPEYNRFGQPDQPVTQVTWFEAHAFCRWLSVKHAARKWQFSLPTDAEWEKVARGPDNFDYSLSRFVSDSEASLYNWRKNPDAVVPVFGIAASRAGFLANRLGVYHMTGNVAEWTQSTDKPFNREHPFVDDERNHDDTRGKRTVRGGSWYSAATSYLYIPYRDSFQPEHRTQELGFRIVVRALP